MCAWMQAGLNVRILLGAPYSIDIASLTRWTYNNMTAAGIYAELVDARKEPMLLVRHLAPQILRSEILGRLHTLKARHESAGRQVPRSQDIHNALFEGHDPDRSPVFPSSGPLEGHRRPTRLIPEEWTERLRQTWTDSNGPFPFQQFVTASQYFTLGQPEREQIRKAVKTLAPNSGFADANESIRCLYYASIVAATNRDSSLADGILNVVVKLTPKMSSEKEITMILRVALQAATAYEDYDSWLKKLGDGLSDIANQLPSLPNECLRVFLVQLDQLETILPINSWCHVRAKAIASSGST